MRTKLGGRGRKVRRDSLHESGLRCDPRRQPADDLADRCGDRLSVERNGLARVCRQNKHRRWQLTQATEGVEQRTGSLSRRFRVCVEIWTANAVREERVAGEHGPIVQDE